MSSEPPIKRPKITENEIDKFITGIMTAEKNLQAILSDEYDKPIPFVKVFVGTARDPKELSKIIQVLNDKIPLKELSHLKRVRKKEVLLCQSQHLNVLTQETIQEYIEHNSPELKDSFQYFREIDVPLTPPKLRRQYLECNSKMWSVNFHPDKQLERLFSDSFFPEYDLKLHRTFMSLVFETAYWYLSKHTKVELQDLFVGINIAVVVDPPRRSIVAIGLDNRQGHPLQHAAMLAIDNVAKTQNGGAWDADGAKNILSGINLDLMMHLKERYRQVMFGAKQYLEKNEIREGSKSDSPYLCTGYDVYLLREPCLMCAMGLVHARAKRVFFAVDNEFMGALKSKTKLQCVESLNHHFDVFTGFL
ncbi:hypothetical protein K1T71_014107 [Dendrolimus kikuchii]|uniref:Uncharacterized protein n=1 Tax=Dendrolimus kikuchii TaxID=765133 RepID=A0ACC1CF51_9NEOP|nr:hypothetical protein K1T71_014107 [Dendrolimus kikuchii]